MTDIHKTAIVSVDATIGENVTIVLDVQKMLGDQEMDQLAM